jgi:ubiquinone biosynthesis protein UbiJ
MLTATLENVLNRGLPRSPRARQLCAELTGRSIAIDIREITRLRVESTGSTLRITRGGPPAGVVGAGASAAAPDAAGKVGASASSAPPDAGSPDAVHADAASPDAIIVGGPFGLLALGTQTPDAVLQRGDVEIRGDAELAQKFRELLLLLRPDLEDDLSVLIGDIPAHQIGRLARGALSWTRKVAATGVENLAEYLGHERRDLVPRKEGEQFLRGVDALREDVDRLEARVDLLRQRRGGTR